MLLTQYIGKVCVCVWGGCIFFHVHPMAAFTYDFLWLLLLCVFGFRIVNSSNQIKIPALAHVSNRFNNMGHVYEMFRWSSTLLLFYFLFSLREWDSRGQIFSIETVAKMPDIFHLFSFFNDRILICYAFPTSKWWSDILPYNNHCNWKKLKSEKVATLELNIQRQADKI